jgi:hypothetical protein
MRSRKFAVAADDSGGPGRWARTADLDAHNLYRCADRPRQDLVLCPCEACIDEPPRPLCDRPMGTGRAEYAACSIESQKAGAARSPQRSQHVEAHKSGETFAAAIQTTNSFNLIRDHQEREPPPHATGAGDPLLFPAISRNRPGVLVSPAGASDCFGGAPADSCSTYKTSSR